MARFATHSLIQKGNVRTLGREVWRPNGPVPARRRQSVVYSHRGSATISLRSRVVRFPSSILFGSPVAFVLPATRLVAAGLTPGGIASASRTCRPATCSSRSRSCASCSAMARRPLSCPAIYGAGDRRSARCWRRSCTCCATGSSRPTSGRCSPARVGPWSPGAPFGAGPIWYTPV